MLTVEDLKKLYDAGPGPRIDIMNPAAATTERIARSLVSLANAHGGVLIIPVIDARGRSPVEPDEIRDRAYKAALTTEPHLIIPLPYLLQPKPDEPAVALAIEIPGGLPHAYSLDGRFLGRNGSRIAPLTARGLRELLLTRSEGTWEAHSPSGCSRDDLDWAKIGAYAGNVVNMGEPTVEDLLLRRGCVIRQGKRLRPTYAGLLLFGKQPQRWVRGAEVLAVRFSGGNMDDVFVRQTISNTLPEQIRRAELFVNENVTPQSRIAGWQRTEQAPYPPGVLREAVVNAIAHRDYRATGGQIHILIFNDRVEVRSPGRLPGHVTLKNLMNERYSRNEAIVQVLADMGFIERLGYGIDRMVRTMKDRGHQPPKFEETDAGFMVTLYAKSEASADQNSVHAPAQNARIEKMLAFIKESGRITNRDYQELCPDVSAESLRRDFVDMVERGVIMRIGDKRGTYYILK
ncbi:MAG: transcriptional regulator [Chloroflexi bacterium]|nr:transcriptional regulator [Chloroflexota bacterium]MCL5273597.1 transcriptional regulator [Chloroflexota bacterium]